jgi:hypothetical protein
VVADLVDVVRALTSDPENRVPHLAFQADALSDLPVLPMDEVQTAFYLRLRVQDRPGVLADITRVLGDLSTASASRRSCSASRIPSGRGHDHHAHPPGARRQYEHDMQRRDPSTRSKR